MALQARTDTVAARPQAGGAVVVVEDMVRIVGIVTERDLLRAVAQRARAAEARVRQWMTADPLTISPESWAPSGAASAARFSPMK